MCFELRKTASRGRSPVPVSRLRTCGWRRSRRVCTSFLWMTLTFVVLRRGSGRPMPTGRPARVVRRAGRGRADPAASPPPGLVCLLRAERLAGLAADDLTLVADALALVRLGRADH